MEMGPENIRLQPDASSPTRLHIVFVSSGREWNKDTAVKPLKEDSAIDICSSNLNNLSPEMLSISNCRWFFDSSIVSKFILCVIQVNPTSSPINQSYNILYLNNKIILKNKKRFETEKHVKLKKNKSSIWKKKFETGKKHVKLQKNMLKTKISHVLNW